MTAAAVVVSARKGRSSDLPRPDDGSGFLRTLTGAANPSCHHDVLMPLRAGRPPRRQTANTEAAQLVDLPRDRLQVLRVDAATHPAQVVNLQAGRDRAAQQFPCEPVRPPARAMTAAGVSQAFGGSPFLRVRT